MKRSNVKTLITSVIVCLLPIIAGIVLYDKLPNQIAIHYGINDVADKYAPKDFALFGIPIIMAVVQVICCVVTGMATRSKNDMPKAMKILQWLIPILTVLLYTIMIEVPLGSTVYVGKSVCLILGLLFIILGNYIPKMSYESAKKMFHPQPKNEKSFRKTSRIMGYSFIGIGLLLIALTFIV